MAAAEPISPRQAATVILLRSRPAPEPGFDVFFVKRHARSGFMANAYVFPGGRVDDADSAPELLDRVRGAQRHALLRRMHGVHSTSNALAHVVAAVRETFEEAFVLLAGRADGRPIDLTDPEEAGRLSAWRERLNAREVSFADLVREEDLVLDGSAVTYFDHWITPQFEPRRFDTRFFVAVAPADQAGVHDGHETTESLWREPTRALAEHDRGQFFLAPPQWCILQALGAHATSAEAISAAAARDVTPCQPHGAQSDGRLVLALPGDALHPDSGGEGARRRVVLDGGRWIWG